MDSMVVKIMDILPQTQCGACGFSGCQPYAEALAHGNAAHNLCKPGGKRVVQALSDLLNLPGIEPEHPQPEPILAQIDAEACIGCTMCLKVCPTGAIVGAKKQIHAVVAEDCTGCGRCAVPCPVACISFVPHPDFSKIYHQNDEAAQYAWEVERAQEVRQMVVATTQRQAERRKAHAPAEALAFVESAPPAEDPAQKLQSVLSADTLAKIAAARTRHRKKCGKTSKED